MKLKILVSSLIVVGGCLAGQAFAATCNNTQGTATVGTTPVGSNCGHNLNYSGSAALCGGTSFSTTGTDVWVVNLNAGNNFTFGVTSAAFTPDIALLVGSCADNATCVNGTDYTTGTGTATSATVSGQAAGTYYLVVTDSTAVGAQCGAYSLTLTGTLPVKLQEFSVQ
jgi:hypothetical protein